MLFRHTVQPLEEKGENVPGLTLRSQALIQNLFIKSFLETYKKQLKTV